MQLVPSAGKHSTCAKRGKTFNLCQARENIQPVPSAENHAASAKYAKTCNQCQARENIQPVPSAGKHATGAKCGKTWSWCQAWENMQPVPSAEKHATCAKRGKTCNRYKVRENTQPVQSVLKSGHFVLLEHVLRGSRHIKYKIKASECVGSKGAGWGSDNVMFTYYKLVEEPFDRDEAVSKLLAEIGDWGARQLSRDNKMTDLHQHIHGVTTVQRKTRLK